MKHFLFLLAEEPTDGGRKDPNTTGTGTAREDPNTTGTGTAREDPNTTGTGTVVYSYNMCM